MFQKTAIAGYLGADPEMRYTPRGKAERELDRELERLLARELKTIDE